MANTRASAHPKAATQRRFIFSSTQSHDNALIVPNARDKRSLQLEVALMTQAWTHCPETSEAKQRDLRPVPASAELLEVLGFMEPGYRPRVAVGTGGAAVFTGVSWEFFFQLLSGSSRRSFSAEWPVQWALTRNWLKLQRPQPFRLFLRACHRLPAPPTAPSDCPAQFRAHPRECSMTSALASRTLVGRSSRASRCCRRCSAAMPRIH